MGTSVHNQIREKLALAETLLDRLTKAEEELETQKSLFQNAISDTEKQFSQRIVQLANKAHDEVSEIKSNSVDLANSIKSTHKKVTDDAIAQFKADIKQIKIEANENISKFEEQTKTETFDSQKKIKSALETLEAAKSDLDNIQVALKAGNNPKTGWAATAKKHELIIADAEKNSAAIKDELTKAKNEIVGGDKKNNSILVSVRHAQTEILDFEEKIYGDKDGNYAGSPALETAISTKKSEMDRIVDYTTDALKKLTDKSLDSAFSDIAKAANQSGQIALFLSICSLVIMASMSFWVFETGLNITDFLYRFTFLIPLGFAVFFLNRERKVQHVVEITYKYKSALARALQGYRNLYDLEHSSEEYMELFDVLKNELLRNPMKDAKQYMNQDLLNIKINTKEGSIDTMQNLSAEQIEPQTSHSPPPTKT